MCGLDMSVTCSSLPLLLLTHDLEQEYTFIYTLTTSMPSPSTSQGQKLTCVLSPQDASAMTATSNDNASSLLQELMQTRHNLSQLEQQLQDSSHKATKSEQQHQALIMRLTRDLEQEQMARSYSPALPLPLCMPLPFR